MHNESEKCPLKINWFPGHMKKATDKVNENIKNVDAIIQVIDARAPQQSLNPDLAKIISNKPILTLAMKSDWSDYKQEDLPFALLASTKNKNDRNRIIQALDNLLSEKINKLKSKGLINPKFLVMVVGLPNIGKSSLINFLANKNHLQAQNKPGLTKNITRVSINNRYEIYDTPGILTKNIDDLNTGYILSLIRCIKPEILPIKQVLEFGYNYYLQNYGEKFCKYYNSHASMNFDEFVEYFGQKNGMLLDKDIINEKRVYDKLLEEFNNSSFGKIHYKL